MAKNRAKPCILYISRSGSVLDEKAADLKKKIKGKINTDTDLMICDQVDEIEESELINFLQMPSFFSDSKVLILKRIDRYPASLIKLITLQIESLAPGVFVAMTSEKEKLGAKFLKAVKSVGTIKIIRVPTAGQAHRWLKEKAELDKVSFVGKAMDVFLENVGYQLDLLKQEYEKLYTYSLGLKESKIKEEDVNRLVTRVYTLRVFDLVDSLGERDRQGALRALRAVLEEKEGMYGAVTLIYRCFKSMLFFKYNLDDEAEAYIRGNIRASGYIIDKVSRKYRKFSQNYSLGELVQMIALLNECDILLRDAHDPRNLMVKLISDITGS